MAFHWVLRRIWYHIRVLGPPIRASRLFRRARGVLCGPSRIVENFGRELNKDQGLAYRVACIIFRTCVGRTRKGVCADIPLLYVTPAYGKDFHDRAISVSMDSCFAGRSSFETESHGRSPRQGG